MVRRSVLILTIFALGCLSPAIVSAAPELNRERTLRISRMDSKGGAESTLEIHEQSSPKTQCRFKSDGKEILLGEPECVVFKKLLGQRSWSAAELRSLKPCVTKPAFRVSDGREELNVCPGSPEEGRLSRFYTSVQYALKR